MGLNLSLASLRSRIEISGSIGLLKVLAFFFALFNLKNLPFAWHFRLLRGLFTQIRSSRVRVASRVGAAALFQPLIISSRSGFLECDYNFHKSNSTYFSDSDVGRLHLLVSLCTHGIERTRKELAKEGKESFGVMLGGVSCNFKREIKPYEAYEVWTRVLCWDAKWLYLVQHFVKKGAVKPGNFTLQPWRKTAAEKERKQGSNGQVENGDGVKTGPHPAIFASVIAKYVFKKGRRTILPERVLRASELFPRDSMDLTTPPVSMTPVIEGTSIDAATASAAESLTPDNAGEIMATSLTATNKKIEWDWNAVEMERLRGMKIAEIYGKLDALNDEFTAEKSVLGRY